MIIELYKPPTEKQKQEKKNIGAFDTKEILLEVQSIKHEEPKESQAKKTPKTQKSKMKTTEKEIKNFKNVLNHSGFRSGPLSTLQEHLKNRISSKRI
jgi:DNA gyrase/topoisomerase IV subunit B